MAAIATDEGPLASQYVEYEDDEDDDGEPLASRIGGLTDDSEEELSASLGKRSREDGQDTREDSQNTRSVRDNDTDAQITETEHKLR